MARTRTQMWALLHMSRPDQLLLVAVVAGLGAAMAVARGGTIGTDAVGLAGAALISTWASLHYTNEWADAETDRLTTAAGTRTRFSGGSRILPGVHVSRTLPAVAAIVTGLLAAVLTWWGWTAGVIPTTAVGLQLLTAGLGYAYSLPPFRLAWRGLGELANSAVGGIVLPLYGVAIAGGTLGPEPVLATLPFAGLVFANLLATQWPDRIADGRVGKRSLAVRWPPSRIRVAFLLSTAGAYASAILVTGVLPRTVLWATFLGLPLSTLGAATITRWRSPFPAVSAMVVVAIGQTVAWGLEAGLLP
ncbi:MAG: prenyltransferase [Halobacteriaceae archaeon]